MKQSLRIYSIVLLCMGGCQSSSASSQSAKPTATPQAEHPVATSSAEAASTTTLATLTHSSNPQTAQECKDLLTEIVNEVPDGGIVMTNAQVAKDAGVSDRLLPLVDTIKSHRSAFRCCFDQWSKSNPGKKGKVVLVLELLPDGGVKNASIDHIEGSLVAEQVDQCVVSVAQAMSYPPSPSGKVTRLTYPFEFVAKASP